MFGREISSVKKFEEISTPKMWTAANHFALSYGRFENIPLHLYYKHNMTRFGVALANLAAALILNKSIVRV